MASPVPANVEIMGGTVLRLEWGDDGTVVTDYPAWDLRVACHCAACVSEMSGRRTLNPATIRSDVVIRGAELTGNYGISLDFSDGHSTGIYSWLYLVELVDDEATRDRIMAVAT